MFLLLALSLSPQLPQPLFLPVTEGIEIPARTEDGQGWNYRQLFADYLTVTKQRAVYSLETHLELESISSTFEFEFSIPPEKVQETVEALLALEDFALALPSGEGPARLLRLLSLREPDERRTAKNSARLVSLSELSNLQAHPAVIVECVIPTGPVSANNLLRIPDRIVSSATSP